MSASLGVSRTTGIDLEPDEWPAACRDEIRTESALVMLKGLVFVQLGSQHSPMQLAQK